MTDFFEEGQMMATVRAWDGEEWVDWPEDEPRYCLGCGADLVTGEAHGIGCDEDEDGDGEVLVGLVDELALIAADPANAAERALVDAVAEASFWASLQ